MKKMKEGVTYRELIGFYLPLAILPMMISLTHTVVNSALARLPLPEMSIALFTVVKSITNILNSPTIISRHLVVSLVKDRSSFQLVKKFLLIMTLLLSLLLFVLGLSPLGSWIFRVFFGFQDPEKISLASRALIITAFLPPVVTFRNTFQGIVTALRKTEINLPGVFMRLFAISIFLWWVVSTGVMAGVIAGSLAWVLGIALEGVFIFGFIIYKYNSVTASVEEIPEEGDNLTMIRVIKFFLPLSLMIILTMFIQPVIQSGISQSRSPVKALAAYGVAWSLVILFSGPLRLLNQMVVVYTQGLNDKNWFSVKRFSLMTGILISGVILLLALTPLGFWLLHSIIGVSIEVANMAQQAIFAFSLFPFIRSFREIYWGVLINQRTTQMIGIAKIVNIIIVSGSIFLGLAYLGFPPAVIGALSFTLGEILETIIIRKHTLKIAESGVSLSEQG